MLILHLAAANNATDTWVRNAANAASSYANSAFGTANTSDSKSQSASLYANAAFALANTLSSGNVDQYARDLSNAASLHSNTAFNFANTLIGTGTSIVGYVDEFLGDGACTEFTLINTPNSENLTLISISGLVQSKNNYSLTGNVITFSTAPPLNSKIEINTFSGGGAGLSFDAANSAGLYANAAFALANTVSSGSVDNYARPNSNAAFEAANSGSSYANSAYGQANTATTNAATADGKAVTAGSYANSAYGQANTATTNAATADSKAVTAGDYANSAFGVANTKYSSSGGTVSGDVIITGNLTVSGTRTIVDTEIVTIADNLIDLNSNFTTGTPTENGGIRVIRGDEVPVQLRWNESAKLLLTMLQTHG